MLDDMVEREEDRQVRENEILKVLATSKIVLKQVDKHIRKMMRKVLLLTVEDKKVEE